MEDENEYKKLPTEEKCVHKLWKARLAGYEEAIKLFNQIDDEKSPEWNKYLGLIKKFVTDGNVVAQEKGLEAALVFAESCALAGRTSGEVMAGIVAKCIGAPKAKTRDLALQITLMYVEIERADSVQEELMKGLELKNPKVVAACVAALTTALRLFGNKVVGIKPMVKKIPVLLADRDKAVRDETKALVVEMHRWIGPAIEPHIASLQPVVQQELREAFSAGGGAAPARYLRSQQPRDTGARQCHVDGEPAHEEGDEPAAAAAASVDPFDLLDPVAILPRLPKDFYEKVEKSKWQERKEALDSLEALLKSAPRLEPGDYADLVRALKKIISKDSNVVLVALATRLLAAVARGLRNKFAPYASACACALLEKFKEKKTNVVAALREAIDAVYPSTSLEALQEDVLAAFDNKNPSVRAETALFVSRALAATPPRLFGKKLIKVYVTGLLKLLESADPTVRDAAAEALGTATKLVGERAVAPHIGKIDALKEQKIKEFAEKAVLQCAAAPKEPAAKPPPPAASRAGSAQPKPVKRPAASTAGGARKPPAGAAAGAAAARRPAPEPELTPEEVDEKAEELLPADVFKGLSDSNWKVRLAAVQGLLTTVQNLDGDEPSSQLLFRVVNRKPGLKDTNVQVLKARLEVAKYIAENFPLSITSISAALPDVVARMGESACTALCGEWLGAGAAAVGPAPVAAAALAAAFDAQRSPRVQAELLAWLAAAAADLDADPNVKTVVFYLKKALSATNPAVRTAAIAYIGHLSAHAPGIVAQFDDEKAATKQLIQAEVDKHASGSPPPSMPRRPPGEALHHQQDIDEEEPPPPAEDVRARTDIAPLITDSLVAEIQDKNWKVRSEGLEKLKAIISSSAPIKSSLGSLPQVLLARILDSNSKLAQTTLQICELLATALGTGARHHARTFFPAFYQAFGDSKAWIRAAARACAERWCAHAGAAAALEADALQDALRAGSAQHRAPLLAWLADMLLEAPAKSLPREDLAACAPLLYACAEERSADVRKAAADCVYPFMLHLGYEGMVKQMDKLKPGSKTVIQALLDKARPNLPVQPLPKQRKEERAPPARAPGKQPPERAAEKKPVKGRTPAKPSSARGRKDDEDATPLLPNNSAKNQRIIDDQKLKVLKWNFTVPREEFFDLLKEQLASAGASKALVANMFHADFRYHLKAIESLSEDLAENGPALTANLDLVLKWLTLRFFDTNPSVILKGLEYLSLVFQYLIDSDYVMAEYEANCFIPYLISKVGDPKDAVRNGVKSLFKQICVVYSVTKLAAYLMEGLKSKNARQRAECLECVCSLLETYGTSVLAAGALRELARHIADRDNAVRSAALNCVAAVYFLQGERIYKTIGQLSDKDLSLLEERIKRAGKSKSAEARRSMVVPLSASGRPVQPPSEEPEPKRALAPADDYDDEEDEYVDPEPEPQPPPPAPVAAPAAPSGPFGLDPTLIARLDAARPAVTRAPLPEPDLAFLYEPVPPVARAGLLSPSRPPAQLTVPAPPPPAQTAAAAAADHALLADTIHSIASPDPNSAIRALSLITGALASGRGAALRPHGARLATAAATQLERLRAAASPDSAAAAEPLFRCLVQMLTAFLDSQHGGALTEASLRALLVALLGALRALGALGGGGERLVRALNNVCVRMLERAPCTPLMCAIISLLHDSISASDPTCPRYQDLLLKCFWKTLKLIPSWDRNALDYDAVLYKIHLFYKAYPNSYWKKNSEISDTPYRTVKTLVHTLVKKKGTSIINHLTLIPDVNDSDLYPYLLKVFKQVKLDDKPGAPSPPAAAPAAAAAAPAAVARAVQDQLAHILKCIANKEPGHSALLQLHELRERHPEVDIWACMQGSPFFFRSYVEQGLEKLKEQRRPDFRPEFRPDDIDVNNENEETSHLVFLERLRALQAKAGLKTTGGAARSPQDARVLTDSLNDNALPKPQPHQLELNTSQPPLRSEANVDALRLKLQQIKSSAKR